MVDVACCVFEFARDNTNAGTAAADRRRECGCVDQRVGLALYQSTQGAAGQGDVAGGAVPAEVAGRFAQGEGDQACLARDQRLGIGTDGDGRWRGVVLHFEHGLRRRTEAVGLRGIDPISTLGCHRIGPQQ